MNCWAAWLKQIIPHFLPTTVESILGYNCKKSADLELLLYYCAKIVYEKEFVIFDLVPVMHI